MPPRLPVSSFRAGGNANAPASSLGSQRMMAPQNPSQLSLPGPGARPAAASPAAAPMQAVPQASSNRLSELLVQALDVYLTNGPNPADTQTVIDFVQAVQDAISPGGNPPGQQAPGAPAPAMGGPAPTPQG